MEQHPILTVDKLSITMSGAQKFSCLDLPQAYQQMAIDEASSDIAAIHTHRGLYLYLRLPFGTALVLAIFQKEMERILSGIAHVAVYLDNILVTGRTRQEHLATVVEVFRCLEQAGLKVKRQK